MMSFVINELKFDVFSHVDLTNIKPILQLIIVHIVKSFI